MEETVQGAHCCFDHVVTVPLRVNNIDSQCLGSTATPTANYPSRLVLTARSPHRVPPQTLGTYLTPSITMSLSTPRQALLQSVAVR
jgi:hypothetical protein